MLQPFFHRAMKYKSGQDVLKLFEQFRKNLKLNKSNISLTTEEKNAKLKGIKKEFYDGLIGDLLQKDAYKLAQIIYSEKKRDKFKATINDHLIGLKIFSSQMKLEEYKEIFNELCQEESEFTFDKRMAEEIAATLLKFKTDEH